MFKNNTIEFIYPTGTKDLLEDIFPIPIKFNLPEWYKNLKTNEQFRTIKSCMPFLDAMTSGYLLKMPQDFFIDHNFINKETQKPDSVFRFSINDVAKSHLEKLNLNLNTIQPEVHSSQQLGSECPYHNKNKNLPYYKILNPFIIKTPPGYSCLFLNVLNNYDDRFEIISGIVDTDSFNANINFPIIINGDKYSNLKTTIKRGTPYVQVFPFKREKWKMKMKESNKSFILRLLEGKKLIWNNYKKLIWNKKSWN